MKWLLTLFVLLSVQFVRTQDRVFQIDGAGGFNFASLPDSSDFQTANYFHFGVSNRWQLDSLNGLRFDFVYARQGAKQNSPYIQYYLNYIELPFYYERQVFEDLYFQVGVRTAYLLNAQEGFLDGSKSSGKNASKFPVEELFNHGFVVGFNTRLQDDFYLYARYTRSVAISNETIVHQGVKLGLMYTLNKFSIQNKP